VEAFSWIRASDADRDRVLDVLGAAARDGRLTLAELDERVGAALSARTFGELAALTADLAARAQDVIRIRQRGGSVVLGGRWAVPRRLVLRPSWCDVMLDFTDALITHSTLPVELNMRGGSLILVAGPGTVVDTGALAVRCTDVTTGAGAGLGRPIALRIKLAGWMRYGWLELRHPNQ
jgi:Domain of unknown function (DUF1707)